MNTQGILLLAGAGVALYFLARILFKADTRIENRRRNAIELSSWCASNGLPLISKVLNDYAVSDYSGVIRSISDLRSTVTDPDLAGPALRKFLKVQLTKQLDTPEGREEILGFIEKHYNLEIDRKAIEGATKKKLAEVTS